MPHDNVGSAAFQCVEGLKCGRSFQANKGDAGGKGDARGKGEDGVEPFLGYMGRYRVLSINGFNSLSKISRAMIQ